MRILGIETSCDETAAAVLDFKEIKRQGDKEVQNVSVAILSNVVHSQIATHRKTGGVVPEVAAREHVQKIIPVVEKALGYNANTANQRRHPECISGSQPNGRRSRNKFGMTSAPVDVIAVTYGPGLITSLMVGVETARTLSWAWKIPLVAVNHMEGHISAAFLKPGNDKFLISNSQKNTKLPISNYQLQPIAYPALALVVSGGHTELVLMRKPLHYQIIGATRDDAVGEAFDKVARILGLEYPGGPVVSKLAELGDPKAFPFSPPMIKSPDYDFSFSGIKTAVLYKVRDMLSLRPRLGGGSNPQRHPELVSGSRFRVKPGMTEAIRNNLCASFQKAVVDVLVAKTIRAAKEYKVKTIILAGGVAANKQLREQLRIAIDTQIPYTLYLIPYTSFCTDNAVMIALAGYFRAQKKQFTPWQKLDVDPNLVLGD